MVCDRDGKNVTWQNRKMIIDMHIHSRNSDGVFTVEELVKEAKMRNIGFMSITDHDSIDCQEVAMNLVPNVGIHYLTGVELNVTFSHPSYREGKSISLDFLGYQFDAQNKALHEKLQLMARYREQRASKIMRNLNAEFKKEAD